jgi:DNA-binding MarR family transcriptional regulator
MGRTSKRREALVEEVTNAFRSYQRAVDALDETASELMGVNRTDARVLDLLQQYGRLTAGEIAVGSSLSSGAVTGVLDRLERAGYARRVRDEADRRRVLVEATTKLHDRANELYAPIGPKSERAIRGYSDAELELVARFVRDATAITVEHAAELRELRDHGG